MTAQTRCSTLSNLFLSAWRRLRASSRLNRSNRRVVVIFLGAARWSVEILDCLWGKRSVVYSSPLEYRLTLYLQTIGKSLILLQVILATWLLTVVDECTRNSLFQSRWPCTTNRALNNFLSNSFCFIVSTNLPPRTLVSSSKPCFRTTRNAHFSIRPTISFAFAKSNSLELDGGSLGANILVSSMGWGLEFRGDSFLRSSEMFAVSLLSYCGITCVRLFLYNFFSSFIHTCLSETRTIRKSDIHFLFFLLYARNFCPFLNWYLADGGTLVCGANRICFYACIVAASFLASYVARKHSSWFGRSTYVFPSKGMTPNTNNDGTRPLGPAVSLSALTVSLSRKLSDRFPYFSVNIRKIRRRGPFADSSLPIEWWNETLENSSFTPWIVAMRINSSDLTADS